MTPQDELLEKSRRRAELLLRHGACFYEIDFGDEGKESYIKLSDFDKIVAALDEQDRDAEKRCSGLQAKIDELMLEYCPDEMTPEQFAEWARHQVPVSTEARKAIDAMRDRDKSLGDNT